MVSILERVFDIGFAFGSPVCRREYCGDLNLMLISAGD